MNKQYLKWTALMNRLLCALFSVLLMAPFLFAEEPVRERIEWIDIWVTDADKDDLPRVLLVGDSITRGYFGDVEKHFSGKAYCPRLTTSKCVSDSSFIDDLHVLLKQYKFAVIHFNNGLHGWRYTETQYKDGLHRTVAAITDHASDAKLIWATSTPVREKDDLQQLSERTERVKVRNAIAGEIMKEAGIQTNDLFGLAEQNPEWHSTDGVHFNAKGNEALAKQVAESVAENLSLATPSKK